VREGITISLLLYLPPHASALAQLGLRFALQNGCPGDQLDPGMEAGPLERGDARANGGGSGAETEKEPEEILVMVDGREMALHDVLPEDEAQVLSH
jgi:hypothetical protein